jgi:hypothetical protein
MLQIRAQQMTAFEQAALRRFEDEMVVHCKQSTLRARLCKVIGDEQLRVALRQAMERASTYGFTYRGPLRLYIELAFLFGSDFDTDPQYPAIGRFLNASGDQMERAEQIHQEVLDYQEKVYGPQAVNVRTALEALLVLAQKPITFSADNFVGDMLQEIKRAFPQKAAFVGDDALTALVREGRTEARKYRFPTLRGDGLLVTLKFAFGHGCTDDPLYPWISRTLIDEKIIDPAARAKRLENKAVTWLEHVLARPPEGAQT